MFKAIPLVRGKLGQVYINPRPAGVTLDFLPKTESGVRFSAGVSMRYRGNRTGDVRDEVVARATPLDSAFEIGPSVGVSFPAVLNRYDSVTVNLEARWDVLGAHNGFVTERRRPISPP